MCFPPQATRNDIEEIINRWSASTDISRRPQLASLIARHDRNGIRTELGDLVETVGPVNYPGYFRNNTSAPLGGGWSLKFNHLKDYQFNICPENSNRSGYVTEKLFNAIEAGCIPIYWGGENDPEPDIINPDRVLFHRPDHPQFILDSIRHLISDPKKIQGFHDQPPFVPGAANKIYAFYERLENRLIELLK